jgi:hypothetical protein
VSGALRALAVCAPVAVIAPAAVAQSHQQRAVTVDIPAQPLAEALAKFARQTGLQVVYVSGVVRNQQSHAISAGLSSEEALARLLEGTGLRFEYLTAHSVRILPAAVIPAPPAPEPSELPAVIVTANRREENLQEVPISHRDPDPCVAGVTCRFSRTDIATHPSASTCARAAPSPLAQSVVRNSPTATVQMRAPNKATAAVTMIASRKLPV